MPENLLKHSLLKNERVLASEHVKIGQHPPILIFLTTSLVLLLFLMQNTSLAVPGALAHRLQRRNACNTSPPNLSKMADGAWKYVKPYVIDPSDQLLLNKFFDPSTPSMRT